MRASLTALASGLLVIALMAVSGCGLKGDLYLPEDESAVPSPEVTGNGEGKDEEDRQAVPPSTI